MTNTTPTPEPSPDDVARGLAELERHLTEQAPPAPAHPAAPPVVTGGETKRVRRLRAEVTEAHHLAALQDDDAPLLLDTPKVRKRRKAAREASRLHELAQDPAMRAWQAARMLRLLVAVAMVSLTLALAWSTAGVQHFAAEGAALWSPSWVFAWLVEPFMSMALLFVVGARAYLATRGQPIVSRTLVRIEGVFLALTFGMNVWPYLPWSLPEGKAFTVSGIVLHILGPSIAVAIVLALPIVLGAFAGLDHERPTGAPTGPTYWANAAPGGPDIAALAARVHDLIDAGELPEAPSATRIQRTLRCGMDTARAVRDELAGGAA
ncbi:conjugal transfer protein TraI [Streptosporangium roseum]|uniref:conjugal transfer protein TraI n=1 Tax=Streptosporangium roseum TaxID=2001 RepID=UPI0012DF5956|nr:conjugal transfer protein TraI [Streptosporangium roseum]